LGRPGARLAAAIAFHVVAGSNAKIDAETKAEFAAAVETAFETPPTFDELLVAFAVLDAWHPVPKGRAPILKRLYPHFSKKALKPLSEEQVIALAHAAFGVVPNSKYRDLVYTMRDQWPKSPELVIAQYDVHNTRQSYRWGPGLSYLLDEASELAAGLPRERQQRILDEIKERRAEEPEIGNLAEQMLDFLESEGIDF
jgi:hypothetical protein